jgi:hypothetical protein
MTRPENIQAIREAREENAQRLVDLIFTDFHSFGGFRFGYIRDDIIVPFLAALDEMDAKIRAKEWDDYRDAADARTQAIFDYLHPEVAQDAEEPKDEAHTFLAYQAGNHAHNEAMAHAAGWISGQRYNAAQKPRVPMAMLRDASAYGYESQGDEEQLLRMIAARYGFETTEAQGEEDL